MTIEYSALFCIKEVDERGLDFHVGDDVWIQEIESTGVLLELRTKLKITNPDGLNRLMFRQEHEHYGLYSHRFYFSLDAESLSAPHFLLAEQRIARAIVLSRIVKPLPIPSVPTIILKEAEAIRVITHCDFYSTAYIRIPNYRETLSRVDVEEMRKLWPGSENIYSNRVKYPALHRALHAFNYAYHIDPTHIGHVVLHSALEALICTSIYRNKKQVVGRLNQICGVKEEDGEDIYDYCCGVKHAAEPALPNTVTDEQIHPKDLRRMRAGNMLDESLRYIFRKALEDESFANLLEDKSLLEKTYPV